MRFTTIALTRKNTLGIPRLKIFMMKKKKKKFREKKTRKIYLPDIGVRTDGLVLAKTYAHR